MGAPRVGYLMEFASLNGGERSLLNFLKHAGARVEPLLLAPDKGPLAERAAAEGLALRPFELRRDGRRRPFDEAVEELAAVAEEEGLDLLHSNSLSGGEYSGLAGERAGIPALSHVRDIQKLKASRRRRLARNRALIAVSEATRLHLIAQGLEADKILTRLNGIDPGFAEGVEPARGLWPGDEGQDPLLLNIGQIGLRKAQDLCLRALLPVLQARPRLRLAFVGERFSAKEESLAFEEALRREARLAKGRVLFLGRRSDVPALLRRARLLVHSAHQEPLGRVLLEAQVAGRAVVATRVGGSAEIIDHGRSGWLVPRGDARSLASAVSRLLDDPEQCQRMERASRSRACRLFEPRRSMEGIFEIYGFVLQGNATRTTIERNPGSAGL